MKSTETFKNTIEAYLKDRAITDVFLSENLKKENKNIDECIDYILNTVQASGCNGFEDNEIYNMAIHYYQEDDLEVDKRKGDNANVIVNHQVKLTEEEIAEAKQKAIDEVIKETKAEMKIKKTVKKEEAKKEEHTLFNDLTLF